MNSETTSIDPEAITLISQVPMTDPRESLKAKSKVLLDTLYDEMILWNMRHEDMPLREYLGMTPKDYLDFMQDPEAWALDYLNRRQPLAR